MARKAMSNTTKAELAITRMIRGKKKFTLREAKLPAALRPYQTFAIWNLCNRGELKRSARGVYRRV